MNKINSASLIELLSRLQRLQSEHDGVARPAPGNVGVSNDEVLDDFAQQILHACAVVALLDSLQAMHLRLAGKGRELESRGELVVPVGENYAQAALDYLCPAGATEK